MPMLLMCIHPAPLKAFQNYFIENNLDRLRVIKNPYKLPWSTFVGVLGMPGKSLLRVQSCFMLSELTL